MSNLIQKIIALTAMTFILPAGAAYAQSVTSSDILNALKPVTKTQTSATRSFGTPKPETNSVSSSDRSFIQSLGSSRAIKVEQRDKLIAIVDKSDLPSINIRILFAYDSDRIEGGSFADLNEIGEALLDQSLADSKIMLNGHTDAAGSRNYNQDLSERRALSVKRYLTQRLFVPSEMLVVSGFGEDRLRDPDDPNSGRNRRVEIINLGE